jgi:hypothetical protein
MSDSRTFENKEIPREAEKQPVNTQDLFSEGNQLFNQIKKDTKSATEILPTFTIQADGDNEKDKPVKDSKPGNKRQDIPAGDDLDLAFSRLDQFDVKSVDALLSNILNNNRITPEGRTGDKIRQTLEALQKGKLSDPNNTLDHVGSTLERAARKAGMKLDVKGISGDTLFQDVARELGRETAEKHKTLADNFAGVKDSKDANHALAAVAKHIGQLNEDSPREQTQKQNALSRINEQLKEQGAPFRVRFSKGNDFLVADKVDPKTGKVEKTAFSVQEVERRSR